MKWRSVERAPEWYDWQPFHTSTQANRRRVCVCSRVHVKRCSCTFALLSSKKNVCKEETKDEMRQEKECSVMCECESRTVVSTHAQPAKTHRLFDVDVPHTFRRRIPSINITLDDHLFSFLNATDTHFRPLQAMKMSSLFGPSNARKKAVERKKTRRGKRCKVRVLDFIRMDEEMCFEFRLKFHSIIFGSHTNPTRCASHTLAGAHGEQMVAMVFVNH